MPSFYAFSKTEHTQRKVHKLQVYSDEFWQTVSHTTATSTRLRNDIPSFQKPLHALSGTSPHKNNHNLTLCLFFPNKWIHSGGQGSILGFLASLQWLAWDLVKASSPDSSISMSHRSTSVHQASVQGGRALQSTGWVQTLHPQPPAV